MSGSHAYELFAFDRRAVGCLSGDRDVEVCPRFASERPRHHQEQSDGLPVGEPLDSQILSITEERLGVGHIEFVDAAGPVVRDLLLLQLIASVVDVAGL